ncbi:MAG: flagellar protein FlaG, partial [Candidatus Hydrogenedentes bacterium]|nr:flagellar protein FlaG [Candidatus Hydrogenedentota bacterium]
EATDQFVVEIVNAKNEVIRQIPLEEALRLDVLFRKITGIIFDQKV